MTRTLTALCSLLLLFSWTALHAQPLPQDQYLQIYLLIQEADKLETAGQKASARARYEVGLKRLRALHEAKPDWEPTIVKYRIKYCEDKVQELQGATDANPDQVVPPIPPDVSDQNPSPSTPASSTASTSTDNTESSMDKPMGESSSSSSSSSLTGTTDSPVAVLKLNDDTTTTSASSSSTTGGDLPDDPAILKKRIRELESELQDTRDRLNNAIADAAALRTRVAELEKQLEVARSEKGDASIDALMAENGKLKEELGEAQAKIAAFQGTGESDTSVANLRENLNKLKGQLELAKKENEALQQTSTEFKVQLQDTQKSLEETKTKLTDMEENNPLLKENEVLRGIIERQLKEQARREAAKRLALEEIKGLDIETTKLKTQLDILGSPLVALTDEELSYLRKPSTSLVQEEPGTVSSSLTHKIDYSSRPRVPDEFRSLAEEASSLFANQKFDEAAALYQKVLNAYPESLYALSNLAVVRFQQQNYPQAEVALRDAVRLAPQDAFSHSILGIVLYQQGKYDEAVEILTRAVALDPGDPKTRNYLGIAASQKGWQEAAEQECRRAIELDEKYGDAHFNLAVIYATQKPPSRELARRHYHRSLELGVPRDEELEKLLK